MPGYLAVEGFRARTIMSEEEVDYLETKYPGWLDQRLVIRSAQINARLAKRYAVSLDTTDPPEVVLEWLTALVTLDGYMKRGFNPVSEQDKLVVEAADRAREEIKEAADSKDGLFELPVKQAAEGSSAISRSGPIAYTETSPYTWLDSQAAVGREEDGRG